MGRKIGELCRAHGISEQTYHRWKSKYGGMGVTDARRRHSTLDLISPVTH